MKTITALFLATALGVAFAVLVGDRVSSSALHWFATVLWTTGAVIGAMVATRLRGGAEHRMVWAFALYMLGMAAASATRAVLDSRDIVVVGYAVAVVGLGWFWIELRRARRRRASTGGEAA